MRAVRRPNLAKPAIETARVSALIAINESEFRSGVTTLDTRTPEIRRMKYFIIQYPMVMKTHSIPSNELLLHDNVSRLCQWHRLSPWLPNQAPSTDEPIAMAGLTTNSPYHSDPYLCPTADWT